MIVIPADILIAIGILGGGILGWLVAGMLIRPKRARLVEPDNCGDQGGWPVDASGYPTMLPKTIGQYELYADALDRFFARKAGD